MHPSRKLSWKEIFFVLLRNCLCTHLENCHCTCCSSHPYSCLCNRHGFFKTTTSAMSSRTIPINTTGATPLPHVPTPVSHVPPPYVADSYLPPPNLPHLPCTIPLEHSSAAPKAAVVNPPVLFNEWTVQVPTQCRELMPHWHMPPNSIAKLDTTQLHRRLPLPGQRN